MPRDISIPPEEIPAAPADDLLIYHYTATAGLLGIINNREIWATDVWYMNDAAEAVYGLQLAKKFLDSKIAETGAAGLIARRALKEMTAIPDNPANNARSYLACFSKNSDQLSQWRAYGNYSIGLNVGAIRELAGDLHPNASASLREVVYGEERQLNLLASAFQQTVTTSSPPTNDLDALPAAMDFIGTAGLLAPTFKHEAFSEEAEMRLHLYQYSADTAADLEFRDSAAGLTPYVCLPLTNARVPIEKVIREVVIGPQNSHCEATRAISQLLARRGLSDVSIRPSQAPLRR